MDVHNEPGRDQDLSDRQNVPFICYHIPAGDSAQLQRNGNLFNPGPYHCHWSSRKWDFKSKFSTKTHTS